MQAFTVNLTRHPEKSILAKEANRLEELRQELNLPKNKESFSRQGKSQFDMDVVSARMTLYFTVADRNATHLSNSTLIFKIRLDIPILTYEVEANLEEKLRQPGNLPKRATETMTVSKKKSHIHTVIGIGSDKTNFFNKV